MMKGNEDCAMKKVFNNKKTANAFLVHINIFAIKCLSAGWFLYNERQMDN